MAISWVVPIPFVLYLTFPGILLGVLYKLLHGFPRCISFDYQARLRELRNA